MVKLTYQKSAELIETLEFKKYVDCVMDLVAFANKFYDEQKPWVQAKENINAFNNTIYSCAYVIANLSNLLEPVMPNACSKIREYLNLNKKPVWGELKVNGNISLAKVEPLFSRI